MMSVSSGAPVIELRDVRKNFGRTEVLRGVNLTVPAGKTYAFLGRNGAGKTTTIRMLMGLLHPDAGSIRVLGLDPAKDALAIRQQVGYLAEDQQMWGWMRVREILAFIASFYPKWDWQLAQDLLEKFALPGEGKVKHLSKGQNVRLGLLMALAHRPRLMILDDPALGLDPIMRKEFPPRHRRAPAGRGNHRLFQFSPALRNRTGRRHHRHHRSRPHRARGRHRNVARFRPPPRPECRGVANRRAAISARRRKCSTSVRTAARSRSSWRRQTMLSGGGQERRSHIRRRADEGGGLNLDEIFEAYVVGRGAGDSPRQRSLRSSIVAAIVRGRSAR